MSGMLDQFRKNIIRSVWKEGLNETSSGVELDDKIALGVLLWEVAQSDKKFLPEEKEKIKEILKEYGKISEDQMPVVLESVNQASSEKIDLYAFTHEIADGLPYEVRGWILENLFRVACVDKELSNEEHEIIRKISGLFRLDHKDFIQAKLKVKKEFGMKTI